MAIYHAKTDTIPDGADTSLVLPSDWNSVHKLVQNIAGNTAGTSQLTGNDIVWAGGNGITLSASGSTISINAASDADTYAGTGFTTTSVAGSNIGGTLGTNGLLVAVPNFLTTFNQTNQTVASGNIAGVNTSFGGTNVSGTMTLNSSGLTLSLSAGAGGTQSVQTQASGAIAGTGFTSTTTAGANITAALGTNGLTMAVPAFLTTATQSVQTQASGAIAGSGFTTTSTAGAVVAGTHDSQGLKLAVPTFLTTFNQTNQTVASGGIAGSGFTTTSTAGAVVAGTHDSAGLKLAVPTFITTFNQTNQTVASGGIAGSGFTTTSTAGAVVAGTHDSGGLKLAVPSFLTTFNQTNQTVASGGIAGSGFTTTSVAGTAVAGTMDSGGLKIAVPPYITTYVAQTNQTVASGNIAGTGFTSTSTAGVVVAGTNDTSGLKLAMPSFITTWNQTNQTVASGNIAGVGTTYGGTGVSASLTLNSAGLAMSLSGGTINQTGPVIAAVGSTVTGGSVVFSSSNGISFGLNGSTMTAGHNIIDLGMSNLGNTAGTTGTVDGGAGGVFVIAGSNNITLSQSINGASATVTLSGLPTMSSWIGPDAANFTLLSAPGNASVSVNVFPIPHALSGTRIDLPIYQSLSSSAANNTYGQQWSIYMMILTNDTANNRLMSLSSGSTQTTFTVASNSAGATQINGSGIRPISCPVNFSMTPGLYYIAVNWVTNTFSSGAATTSLNRTASVVGNPVQSANYAIVGDYAVATAATNASLLPVGVFSAASTGLPGTISYSQMTMTGASRLQANFALIFRN